MVTASNMYPIIFFVREDSDTKLLSMKINPKKKAGRTTNTKVSKARAQLLPEE